MPPATSTQIDTQATAARIRPELLRLLYDLPQSKQDELLNFARFLRQQVTALDDQPDEATAVKAAPADSLVRLTGLVALGGDAVTDAEALYDGA